MSWLPLALECFGFWLFFFVEEELSILNSSGCGGCGGNRCAWAVGVCLHVSVSGTPHPGPIRSSPRLKDRLPGGRHFSFRRFPKYLLLPAGQGPHRHLSRTSLCQRRLGVEGTDIFWPLRRREGPGQAREPGLCLGVWVGAQECPVSQEGRLSGPATLCRFFMNVGGDAQITHKPSLSGTGPVPCTLPHARSQYLQGSGVGRGSAFFMEAWIPIQGQQPGPLLNT